LRQEKAATLKDSIRKAPGCASAGDIALIRAFMKIARVRAAAGAACDPADLLPAGQNR
jgi:hypothetical protein